MFESKQCANCGKKTRELYAFGGDYKDLDICWDCMSREDKRIVMRDSR